LPFAGSGYIVVASRAASALYQVYAPLPLPLLMLYSRTISYLSINWCV